MGKLDGRVALITGGNSGIGLATAKRFVQEGAYVFVTGRTQLKLDEAVSCLSMAVSRRCSLCSCEIGGDTWQTPARARDFSFVQR